MLDNYEASAAKVKDRQTNNPPTVSFLRTNNGEFQMYGAESMAGTVAADCGFARPEAQHLTDKAGKDLSAELIGEPMPAGCSTACRPETTAARTPSCVQRLKR